MPSRKIAVLMTCHNRRETTVRCLQSLKANFRFQISGFKGQISDSKGQIPDSKGQRRLHNLAETVGLAFHRQPRTAMERRPYRQLPRQDLGLEVRVFLVDDGSTDRTGEAVRELIDCEIDGLTDCGKGRLTGWVIRGEGDLYWAKGMRLAWEMAVAQEQVDGPFDAFLWLNDDAMLNEDGIGKMLAADDGESLVVGNLCDASGKEVYGLDVNGWVNGNCVLVPRKIYETIGMICGEYSHAWADGDYALQAKKAGFGVVGAGVVGTTSEWHPIRPSLEGKTLRERWRLLFDPKGWNVHDLWLYRRRNWNAAVAVVSCAHLILRVLWG